jgi:hypothetical protein
MDAGGVNQEIDGKQKTAPERREERKPDSSEES